MSARQPEMPDPDRGKRNAGCGLYIIGMLVGGFLLVALFLITPLFEPNPVGQYTAMCIGAVLAFPALAMYLTFPRLLDRYDPEPWYALLGCMAWGGIAACGFSATINSVAGEVARGVAGDGAAEVVGAVISAPFVEEFWKAVGIWGVFFFLRREFDGVVDGIIYATFTALGFAAVENVIYYSRAVSESGEALFWVVVLRGVLGPWGHPLYTAMTGIGFGYAREAGKGAAKWIAPVVGYLGAVFLHALWNGSAVISDAVGAQAVFLLALPLWLMFVAAFVAIVIVLVRRRGRIIQQFLVDEVAIGTISRAEMELAASAFGLMKARMRHGNNGAEFVRAVARLALSKWHTARATKNSMRTVSMDFIVPLRQKIAELKSRVPG